MITADGLRRVVLSLPEAEERETWGHPTFRVRDTMFAAYDADQDAQEAGPDALGRAADRPGPALG